MTQSIENSYSKLPSNFYRDEKAADFPNPQLIHYNRDLDRELNLNLSHLSTEELAQIFSGQKLLSSSRPIALAYAGHQFGNFVPQLGDGRALLLAEARANNKKRYDIQLKGSGQTYFSRNGDGRSSMGPVIREYILSEAMHRLAVPTTRALAAVSTGEKVYREERLPGAVFTRVASSHIRIGTFQFFAVRRDNKSVKILMDYAIERHYPDIKGGTAIDFLRKVIQAQAALVAKWMSIGFIHGVMNTDNTSISGETIDYGPCAFMDHFNFQQVYSYIDQYGRYCYINQVPIIQWNLARLADCLIHLVDDNEDKAVKILNTELETILPIYEKEYLKVMRPKFGLTSQSGDDSETKPDEEIIQRFLHYLDTEQLDFTLSFRYLADLLENENISFYKQTQDFKEFKSQWLNRIEQQNISKNEIKEKMNAVNPLYIPRNHQVERAIQFAIKGDYSLFHEMNTVLANPFTEQPELDFYKEPPLEEEVIENTFCGT